MSDLPLKDDVAIVTGASAGIGAATVQALAANGADIVLAARRTDRLKSLADSIEQADRTALVVETDVSDESSVEALMTATIDRFGRLDHVICNAGVGRDEPVESMSTESYRTMMSVNVDGTFFTARAAIPHLRETAGTLIVVSSFAGQYPRPANPVYAATKWWTQGFALSLAGVIGKDDIGVTLINPTEVRTEFGDPEGEPMADRYDPGEVTEPEEVAEAIVFAAQQEAPTTISGIDIYRRDKFSHF